MRIFLVVLAIILLLLQYKLWFGSDGLMQTWRLKKNIAKQNAHVAELKQRNLALIKQLKNIKNNSEEIEEIARTKFGMIKKGEVFYQIVEEKK